MAARHRFKAKRPHACAGEAGRLVSGEDLVLSTAERFKVNAPEVAWEDFDGEAVIVNLETGEYFSTQGVGAEIWRRLAAGSPVAAVEKALLARFDVERDAASTAVEGFVSSLCEHGLLVPVAGADDSAEPEAVPAASEKRPFLSPSLEKYSDMQDLLLLDPIHETTDRGGPSEG